MLRHYSKQLLEKCFQSRHNLIVSSGLLIGLYYIPIWLISISQQLWNGSSSPVLNLGFLGLGCQILWQERSHFQQQRAYEDERFIGYMLMGGGATLLLTGLSSLSLQAFAWITVLAGAVYSTGGLGFIRKYWLPVGLVLISFYPDYIFLANAIWQFSTLDVVLESSMASVGVWVLQLIRQPAVAEGSIISLPTGAVNVASGCSGFDMGLVLAGTGIIASLFFKLSPIKSVGLIASGIAIALILNVPRIVLLTFAAVYWGEESFKFWHGTWGGQIFATILFTIYYYVIMAFVDGQSSQAAKPSS